MNRLLGPILILFALLAANATAQDLPVFTDGLVNGFQDYSYGDPPPGNDGSDFANPTPFHNGAPSISFIGESSFNAVSFAHPSSSFAAGAFSGLRFFVNGGATGGQKISLMLEINSSTNVLSAPVALDAYIAGGAIPANAWAQVNIPFSALAFTNGGSFDRIDIQTSTGAQSVLYIDDVALTGAQAAAQNYVFGDSFEPEYMFVPQYQNSSIRVYQRATNTTNFSFVREAPLGGGINPNAVAFAADGGLWVVQENSKLLRYTLQSILSDANPTPTAQVGPTGKGSLYDLAFLGASAYVSSDSGILKYPVASMTAGTNPPPTVFNTTGGLPVGLAFDTQGRLWICNYGTPGNLVRMSNLATGAIDVTIGGANINNAEGLSFDEYGSLWVADNNEPTMYAYGSAQLNASGSPAHIGQIDMPTPGGHAGFTGYVGGIRFDRRGDVRANYEYDYTVRSFTTTAAPWNGPSYTSYTSSELTALDGATTDPGRGGIAIWPVPSTVHR